MTVTAPARALRVAGAATPWVADLVAGPAVLAPVLHSGRDAVYLDLRGRGVGVLGARAALVPCGVRTTLPQLPPLDAANVLVGGGSVELPGCSVDVVGSFGAEVGGIAEHRVRRAAVRAQELATLSAGALDPVRALLPVEALRGLATGDSSSVRHLLGRGPGLTPLGDDVLSGWLVTAVTTGHEALPPVRDAVAGYAARTTLLSATLLGCAARGEALPQVRDLLHSLDGPPEASERALDRLVAVGGTSGAGLALGCLTALDRACLPPAAGGAPR
ncbi:MAG: hypothetical protein QOK15_878 [Nocardioidaceae bacterium]|nr:hypothetical protein [Nocardioidaceae bacterium]